jgi:hypothetical protein
MPTVKALANLPTLPEGQVADLYVDVNGKLHVAGSVTTAASAAATVTSSEATVGTTAAALSGAYPFGVQLFADSTNTAPIYLGGAAVTASGATRGMPLTPGSFYTPPDSVQDLSILFAITSVTGQKLVILGVA